MITIDQIHAVAERNNLRVNCTWEQHTKGRDLPQMVGMRIYFPQQSPEAWAFLMSDVTAVPATLSGTRQQTGSGATDNTLHPCYAALLKEVNAKRADVGLELIRN